MSKHASVALAHGLVADLARIGLQRRELLRWMAGAALLPLVGCGSDADGAGPDGGAAGPDGASAGPDGAAGCAAVPEETGGPYPGDGSNGPNALTLSGIVRSDIRSSIAGVSGTAAGVPLTVQLNLLGSAGACAPLVGYAVYIWHCDRDGNYSLYTAPTQNYLRGVQASDASGQVTFTTIFPGCYSGRWPHIHFEVYPSLAQASAAGTKLRTSQLALPKSACDLVYASDGYASSAGNLARVTLASDMVFSDGATLETPAVTGDVAAGFRAVLNVGV
jgi:protocatechuate 3,4-dioxygenase beta subunit